MAIKEIVQKQNNLSESVKQGSPYYQLPPLKFVISTICHLFMPYTMHLRKVPFFKNMLMRVWVFRNSLYCCSDLSCTREVSHEFRTRNSLVLPNQLLWRPLLQWLCTMANYHARPSEHTECNCIKRRQSTYTRRFFDHYFETILFRCFLKATFRPHSTRKLKSDFYQK